MGNDHYLSLSVYTADTFFTTALAFHNYMHAAYCRSATGRTCRPVIQVTQLQLHQSSAPVRLQILSHTLQVPSIACPAKIPPFIAER